MPGQQTSSRAWRRRLKRWRWHVAHASGIQRYTWASLSGLDRLLVELFDGRRDGTFVELGGNDGLQQSNTLALEQLYGWRGLLVEADPELAGECLRNRPRARVACAAAGARWGVASLRREDLMGSIGADADGPASALVSLAPLSDLIDAAAIGSAIDLLSVDVEGAELDVLRGLDLERHRPEQILVETADRDAVAEVLGDAYVWAAQWTHHDHLFTRRGGHPCA